MIFPLFGGDLYGLFNRLHFENKKLPLSIIKHIFRQVLQAIKFTHSINIIHTDLKAENILLQKPINEIDTDKFPIEDFNIILTDYGNACYDYEHFSDYIQTLELRAPEAMLGKKWDSKVDIWTLGCLFFELLTYNTLFSLSSNPLPHFSDDSLSSENKEFTNNDSETDESEDENEDDFVCFLLLFKIQSLLGEIPLKTFEKCEFFNKYYWSNVKENVGQLKYYHKDTIGYRNMRQILQKDYNYGKKIVKSLDEFINKMLVWDPKKRLTAHELLHDSFLQ